MGIKGRVPLIRHWHREDPDKRLAMALKKGSMRRGVVPEEEEVRIIPSQAAMCPAQGPTP